MQANGRNWLWTRFAAGFQFLLDGVGGFRPQTPCWIKFVLVFSVFLLLFVAVLWISGSALLTERKRNRCCVTLKRPCCLIKQPSPHPVSVFTHYTPSEQSLNLVDRRFYIASLPPWPKFCISSQLPETWPADICPPGTTRCTPLSCDLKWTQALHLTGIMDRLGLPANQLITFHTASHLSADHAVEQLKVVLYFFSLFLSAQ